MEAYLEKNLVKKQNSQVIDASGRSLGRLATQIAGLLRGKHKPDFSPNKVMGDSVVVTNSDKLVLTGKKWTDKKYYSHSRWVGSLKTKQARDLSTEELITKAVQGMLPKNKLRKRFLKQLRVYKKEAQA